MVEKAGGLSSNGEISVLDVKVQGYYQKTDFIIGSKEEVERVQRHVSAEKSKKKKTVVYRPQEENHKEEEDEDAQFFNEGVF